MSTRLLSKPGSRHTITDDLESHFFVLMWTALHWVKHDLYDGLSIDMEYLFDQQRPSPDGTISGGAGKLRLYESRDLVLHEIEFACQPFSKLFWDLWGLFAKYLRQRWDLEKGPGKCSQ